MIYCQPCFAGIIVPGKYNPGKFMQVCGRGSRKTAYCIDWPKIKRMIDRKELIIKNYGEIIGGLQVTKFWINEELDIK